VIPGADASSSPGHLPFQAFSMVPSLRICSILEEYYRVTSRRSLS
jgi:hypothetical protein